MSSEFVLARIKAVPRAGNLAENPAPCILGKRRMTWKHVEPSGGLIT
jgi:hypothetical protein